MAIKFATKEERDEFLRQQYEFLRQQYEPATQLPPPLTPSADNDK